MIVADFLHELFAEGVTAEIKEGKLAFQLPSNDFQLPEEAKQKIHELKPKILQRVQQNNYMENEKWLIHNFGCYYTKRVKYSQEYFMQRIGHDRFLISVYFNYKPPRESGYKQISFNDFQRYGENIFNDLRYRKK
jgi:hypothetical protein